MDPQEEATVELAVQVVKETVVPVVQDVIGLFGGDYISQRRKENIKKLIRTAEARAKERGEEFDLRKVSQNIALSIGDAAKDESREELLDLWARLLANAAQADGNRQVR